MTQTNPINQTNQNSTTIKGYKIHHIFINLAKPINNVIVEKKTNKLSLSLFNCCAFSNSWKKERQKIIGAGY